MWGPENFEHQSLHMIRSLRLIKTQKAFIQLKLTSSVSSYTWSHVADRVLGCTLPLLCFWNLKRQALLPQHSVRTVVPVEMGNWAMSCHCHTGTMDTAFHPEILSFLLFQSTLCYNLLGLTSYYRMQKLTPKTGLLKVEQSPFHLRTLLSLCSPSSDLLHHSQLNLRDLSLLTVH